jgi:hypothetical protein
MSEGLKAVIAISLMAVVLTGSILLCVIIDRHSKASCYRDTHKEECWK